MIAKRLVELRSGAGLTQQEAADKAGIHVIHLSKLERGEVKNPSLNTLRALARVYGVTVTGLVDAPEGAATSP